MRFFEGEKTYNLVHYIFKTKYGWLNQSAALSLISSLTRAGL